MSTIDFGLLFLILGYCVWILRKPKKKGCFGCCSECSGCHKKTDNLGE